MGRGPSVGGLQVSRFLDEVTVRVLDPGTLEAFRGPRGHSPEPSPDEEGPGLAPEPLAGAAAPEKTLALSPQLSSEAAAEAASGGGQAGPWRPVDLAWTVANKEAELPPPGGLQAGWLAMVLLFFKTGMDGLSCRCHPLMITSGGSDLTEVSEQFLLAEPDIQKQTPQASDLRGKEEPEALDAAEGSWGLLPPGGATPQLSETACPGGPSAAQVPALSSSVLSTHRLRSPWVPSCLGQPRVLQGRLARSSPSLWDSALQEQKGELRKRLSYTTHKLEKLETEFDSTRHYLEIELRRAQEELEKVTEKLRRIQSNYMALQRINQELEDKLYRMGQHYEEEKRALSHEIVALNSHLLEAKVTIDKLSEDNELYRKDCNLAAQLLQCSQTYGRVHKVSELPSEFQERVSLHMEKHGCSLPAPLCHPSYADSVPTCVIAKVLEKPDPGSLSSQLSDASARDLTFRDGVEKPGPRPPYKEDIYCSDTALYCPEERRRDRRPSVDGPVADVGFLRAQNSTDSAAEEEEEAEAAAFPAGYRHEAFPGYAGSLPTSSSYSRASPLYASYKADSFSERDDLSQGHLAESRFLRAAGDLSLSPGRPADSLPSYAAGEGDRERLGVQLCGAGGSPEPEHSPHSSRDSLEPSSMEASPEMHPAARLSPQPAFPRTGGSGLSRKDSLTKAQLYGTLLN
nr:LOW QUALITY PROTEIN: brain-enriched guanylate kinase-associated protein [Vicugna pacos]